MRVIGKIRSAFANNASGNYRCQQCNAEFELDRQVCPVCGGYSIESTEWSEK
jgi:rRNA maturation endonuclease Nob1